MNPDLRVGNLAAVPSYHYEPVFAREVRRLFEEFRPKVVVLEMPSFPELVFGLSDGLRTPW